MREDDAKGGGDRGGWGGGQQVLARTPATHTRRWGRRAGRGGHHPPLQPHRSGTKKRRVFLCTPSVRDTAHPPTPLPALWLDWRRAGRPHWGGGPPQWETAVGRGGSVRGRQRGTRRCRWGPPPFRALHRLPPPPPAAAPSRPQLAAAHTTTAGVAAARHPHRQQPHTPSPALPASRRAPAWAVRGRVQAPLRHHRRRHPHGRKERMAASAGAATRRRHLGAAVWPPAAAHRHRRRRNIGALWGTAGEGKRGASPARGLTRPAGRTRSPSTPRRAGAAWRGPRAAPSVH